MLLIDQKMMVRLINAQAVRLFGYSREELLGQTVESLMPIRLRRQFRGYMREFFSNPLNQQYTSDLNLIARQKGGSEFPVEGSVSPLGTAEGLWAACSIRDITERKKAEDEQNRLLEEIKQSREELRALTYRLQEVQEIERRQIASELHDRIGQNLTGLNLNLQIVENQLDPQSNSGLRNRLDDSLKLVEETTRQVRDVMADLHPPVLDDYGLVAALKWHSNNFSKRTGIFAQVIGSDIAPRLPANVEMVLFRLVQEALNNVAKHARANQVDIIIESVPEAVSLIVKDDGQGFDAQLLLADTEQAHWGLINMQQRAASIGAQIAIASAPGRGTQVCVNFRRSADGN
jgi:PAS domain S-box-containing protein